MAKRAAKVAVADPQAAIKAKFIEQGSDPVIAKKALEDATSLSRGLWLSFLTFGTYLVITFAGVDHRDLLLETPITLPVLNAPLPLVTFFWVAPILFVIFHLYLLLSLKLLADQVHHYLGAIAETGLHSEAQDRARLQLPNFVVVQVLGGTSTQLNSWAGWLMRFTAFLTLAAGPIILLLFAQLMFLPYHGWGVTMAQRLTVTLDLVFIWYFWRAITRPEHEGLHLWGGVASAAVVVVTFFGLMYPGEKLYGPLSKAAFRETGWKSEPIGLEVFYNTLVLSGETLVGDELFEKLDARNKAKGLKPWEGERSIFLVDRDFRNAEFRDIDLRKTDCSRCDLVRADLRYASLQGAIMFATNLQGASLDLASLQEAILSLASLENASLAGASLQAADLSSAKLQGADLSSTQLQGASLSNASLQGANLDGALLQGASLSFAKLQGASLDKTSLQAAFLEEAFLQGASLRGASLQVAYLGGASLQGAYLLGTSLEGAFLAGASLRGASLRRATVLRNLEWGGPDLSRTDLSKISVSLLRASPHDDYYGLTEEDYEVIVSTALEGVPNSHLDNVRQEIAKLDPSTEGPIVVIDWLKAKNSMALKPDFKKLMIESLISTACGVDGKPYVAQGIVESRLSFVTGDLGIEALPLVEILLAGCPGSEGMDQETIERLKQFKEVYKTEGTAPKNGEDK